MAVKINKIFLLFVLILSAVLVSIFAVPTYNSYASILIDGIEYSTVLEDLQSDSSFNVESYPLNEKDYSLQVIQIAESENKELFIYTYQPSGEIGNLTATSINISTGIEDNLSYKNYKLSLLNSSGTLYKYKVEDFVVKDDALRYYDISSIFRKWNGDIDEDTGNDTEITEVAYEVAKLYTAVTVDGVVSYSCEETAVVDITDEYLSFIRYTTPLNWTGNACDSHFVAFSTNYEIDRLYEIQISYITRTYKKTTDTGILTGGVEIGIGPTTTYEYGEEIPHNETYYADDEVEVDVGLIFQTKYTWNRIQTVDEFLEDKDLTSTALKNIREKQFVLNFYESEYQEWADSVGAVAVKEYETGTRVRDMTILRLKFETNGVTYNLGVINNKYNSSDTPANVQRNPLQDLLSIIFACLLFIVLLVIIWPFLPAILSFVWKVICFPFKLIKSIFKKKDKK